MTTSAATPRIEIPGFTMGDVLGEGATSVVLRGERGGAAYAIKVLRARQEHDHNEASRFRREAAALARLSHPSLLRVYEVSEHDGRPYIVLELVEGDTLQQRLARGPLPQHELLHVGRSVAAALCEVHRRGIVHRDLKPSNILVGAGGAVKIIDFGFAAEGQGGDGDGSVVGTTFYSAPEQLGILKRPVDARADIYALGAVLYECAVGRAPVVFRSTAEFFEKFLTTDVKDAHDENPDVSPALSRMIAKLIAKDPDDRYQSCEGFLADLERMRELDEVLRSGKGIDLGARDRVIGAWEVPLAGRDAELAVARRALDDALTGQGGVVQVEGEGGSGKTRLLRELLRSVKNDDVVVFSGKAHRFERVPFGPLRDAVDDVIYRLRRAEDHAELARMREAAEGGAQYLRRFSRQLDKLIGEVSGPHARDAAVEQARFIEAVAGFFIALARAHRALVLHIDDVQWLDAASTSVLARLSEDIAGEPVLLTTTARNDPESEPARDAFLQAMGKGLRARIELGPLGEDAVNQIVTSSLGTGVVDGAVAHNLTQRSRGNPFALSEYVRSFVDSGVLRLESGRWSLDEKRLRDAKPSADVVDLVVARIGNLDEEVARVLAFGSVVGFEFEVETVSRASKRKPDDVYRALEEATRAGLVEVEDNAARFVHDRVHEAITRRLTDEERADINQVIAEDLDRQTDPSPAAIFAVARHYADGQTDKNPGRVYETSLRAGQLALATFSNQEAHDLLGRALSYVERVGVAGVELAKVHEAFGVACVRTGRHADARAHYEIAITLASEEDRSRLRYLMGQAYASEGKNNLAWDTIRSAMEMERAGLPRSVVGQKLSLWWFMLVNRFLARTHFRFGMAKGKARRRRRLISEMHDAAKILTYFLGDQLAVRQVAQRELFNTHFLGVSPEAAKAHAFFSFASGLDADLPTTEHHGATAIAFAEQVGDAEALARSQVLFGYGLEFAGANVKSQALMRRIFDDVVTHCNASDVGTLILHLGHSLTFQGRARDAVAWCREKLDILGRTGGITFQAGVYGILYSELALLGRKSEAVEARRIQLEYAAQVPNVKHSRAMVDIHALMVLLDEEDLGDECEKTIRAFLDLQIEDYHRRLGYVLVAHARLAQAERDHGAPGAVEALRVAAVEVRRRAVCAVHECHALAFEAALARYAGAYEKARDLLERAEERADASESSWGRFVVYRERARVARAAGNERRMRDEARIALSIARDEGWRARAQQVQQEFGLVAQASAGEAEGASETSGSSRRMVAFDRERYLDAVFRVSLASAGIFDPLEQAKAALDELITLLSAERAAVFVSDVGDALKLLAARGPKKADIEVAGYSTTVVERVRREREPLILTGTEEGEVLGSESITAHNLRSIVACPLELHEQVLGVVYLDSRVAKGLFREDQLDVLLAICNHIAIAMESARMARAETERQALQKDLELTAAVQTFFLPRSMAMVADRFSLTSFYRPAGHCSGDWLWLDQNDDEVELVIADVTGHGAPSAMLTAFLASTYRALRKYRPDLDGAGLLRECHAAWSEVAEGRYLAATVALRVDKKTSTLSWWMAGAPPFLVLKADGKVEAVTARSDHVGGRTVTIASGTRQLAAGDRVFVFTDGCYEIDLGTGRQLGIGGLRRILTATRPLAADEAVRSIWTALEGRMKSAAAAGADVDEGDDITFALLDVAGPSA